MMTIEFPLHVFFHHSIISAIAEFSGIVLKMRRFITFSEIHHLAASSLIAGIPPFDQSRKSDLQSFLMTEKVNKDKTYTRKSPLHFQVIYIASRPLFHAKVSGNLIPVPQLPFTRKEMSHIVFQDL